MAKKRFISAREISDTYGFSPRHWTKMANAGKLPGAYQPSGTGGKWMFAESMFRRWWSNGMRRGSQWPGYTAGENVVGTRPA